MSPRAPFVFEVFYDGACPLCTREIHMLMRLDRQRRIRFTDIADPAFDPSEVGVTWNDLMERIHGRMTDGTLVTGVEVFRKLYGAVGFGWVVSMTRWPLVSHALEAGYRVFAKNRLKWTGRCTDACSLPAKQVSA
ncbi:MAG: DUF393 domain-containing protein [Polyangiaceae bacterium]